MFETITSLKSRMLLAAAGAVVMTFFLMIAVAIQA